MTCKTKTDLIYPPTQLEVIVKNAQGQILSGARVGLFNDIKKFEYARTKNAFINEVESKISNASGTAAFTDLDYSKPYFVYATYRDPLTNKELSNASTTYRIENKLAQGSVTVVEIILQSTETYVSFWAKSGSETLPIHISIGTDTLILNQTSLVAPTSNSSPNSKSLNKLPGTYAIYAKNAKGCFWASQLVVSNGSFSALEIPNCTLGTVVFYTKFNASHLPISVTLSNKDVVGDIENVNTFDPSNCSSIQNGISIQRDPNKYTYSARSSDGKCLWAGSFEISSDACILIPLEECP